MIGISERAAMCEVNFAPMLSVLFVGTRMRALQLSQGQPDEYDLPQSSARVSWLVSSVCWVLSSLEDVTRRPR